ncbi:MAG: class C beta-lactamase [Telluria sp.]
MKIHPAIACITLCLLPLASWAADDTVAMRAAVDAAIRPLMAEHNIPGMAVAVTVNGRSAYFNYGVASREKLTPVSEMTLFEIGSISKTFTATLAAYAQEIGKLSLDDHPGKFIPQLQGTAINRASLLNLGTYTAGGLPLQFPDDVDDAGMIRYFAQWKPDAAPGTQRRYSNPSIGLLGHVTALAFKRDFTDLMETQLFPRLGLHHTHLRVPDQAMAAYAWGYAKENKPIRMNSGVLAMEGAGAKSTSADMIRYLQANIDPGRLGKAMQGALRATHVGHFQVGDMVQGLGWEQYPYPVSLARLQAGNASGVIWEPNAARHLTSKPAGPALFNKTGSTFGFGAYVAFVPEKKIGIVLLANRNYPIPERVKAAHAILERLATRQTAER